MSHYSDEQVIAAIDAAPAAVRSAIGNVKTSQIVADIGAAYKLHIDVIGKLSQLNRNMLIGLSSPAEVLGELIMSGVDTEAAKKILSDLNARIFVPVQESIRSVGATAAAAQEQRVLQVPSLSSEDLGIAPLEAAKTQPVEAVPQPAAETTPVPAQPYQPASDSPAPLPTQHAVFASQPGQPAQGPWQPAASVHVFVPSHQPNPTPTLPGSPEPVPVAPASLSQVPAPAAPSMPTPSAETATPIVKERVTDPYREPI